MGLTDQERISLILAEMERTAVLRAAKSKLLVEAVSKLIAAREMEAQGIEAQRMAEDEIIALKAELQSLEAEDQRNAQALRNLQQIIDITEQLSNPVEPIEPPANGDE